MSFIRNTNELYHHGFIQEQDIEEIKKVEQVFSVSLTPQMVDLVAKENAEGPLTKQFIPQPQELMILDNELSDPIGDNAHNVQEGIIHRYPDRCLLMPVNVCPVYCRFCFRREKVGSNSKKLSSEALKKAINYIADHPEIWEVIITGGDPLILNPKQLANIILSLNKIQHLEVIRIHTRIPIVDSKRITDEMLNALKVDKALYIALHANHPSELTPQAVEACAKIVDAGIPMLSQTVLLKGINNNIETLSQLMRAFVKNRIKPYYIHHPDLARGTSHFRVSIQEGQALIKALRGRYSGLCQPTYVLEIPGGYGKIPINDHFITPKGKGYCMEDYQGRYHEYADQ